jgi:hypothetical protein
MDFRVPLAKFRSEVGIGFRKLDLPDSVTFRRVLADGLCLNLPRCSRVQLSRPSPGAMPPKTSVRLRATVKRVTDTMIC